MAVRQVELELKYRVADPEAAARLASVRALGPFRAAGRAHQVQIEDRYIDTADGALGRAGYAVRLRRGPTMTVISVKSTTPASSALHRREELEGPGGLSLDAHAWPSSAARSLVLEHAGDAPLMELVTVRQLRRTRTLADESAEVELSLDEVAVVARGRVVERFIELEAELRRGPATALDTLAAILAADPDLAAETSSKLERALAAAGGPPSATPRRSRPRQPPPNHDLGARPGPDNGSGEDADRAAGTASPGGRSPEPVSSQAPASAPSAPPGTADGPALAGAAAKEPASTADVGPPASPAAPGQTAEPAGPPRLVVGKSPGVTADDVLAEAGRKVLRFHFARVLAREAGTRDGSDIENLHGMRVATRRMRAAWRVFGPGFRANRTNGLRSRLRVLAGRLGAVRDLDVLIEAAVAHQAGLGAKDAAAFEPLIAAWRAERAVARTVLVRELDSVAYQRLVEEYRVFVVTEGAGAVAPGSPVTPHRVRDTAGSRIWLAYEQVRAYESVLRWADIETIHQLRIAGKWLRYTLEFFREALGPEVDQLIPRVVVLQDHLGWLHDADVTIALTRQFLVENAGSLSREETQAVAGYLALKERELVRLRRTMSGPWRAVSGTPFRRLLGRAVSAL